MATLLAADLQATLGFVREAEAVSGPDPFPTELLDSLRTLVPCDTVGCCEQDRAAERELYFEACTRGREADATAPLELERIFWLLCHQSPIVAHQEHTGDFGPIKLSDFLTRRELHRLEIHRDFFRPVGIEHRLVVGLPGPRTHTKCFLFDRGDARDFEERDRLVLHLLRPHLVASYAAARDRRLAAALTLGEVRRIGHLLLLREEDSLLTKREREIVDLLAEGRTNGEIALHLTISPATVRTHLENIYAKLGVHTRTAAVARAERRGTR